VKISRNFILQEFEESQTAKDNNIDNYANTDQIIALTALTTACLQPVRDQFGPVRITSGFRHPDLAPLVNSSVFSQHCAGEACDWEVRGVDNMEVAKWVIKNLPFDQLILEFYEEGNINSGWIHLSYKRDGGNRYEVKHAVKLPDGSTEYRQGLFEGWSKK
tara:strand:- start:18194 stop:18676 length:483 start_codon:yes stop_codon:yes gene_type:complete